MPAASVCTELTTTNPLFKANVRKCTKVPAYKKRSIKREQALTALLTNASICQAAVALGVAESTVRRWLSRPDFKAQYMKARRQCLDNAIAQIQQLTSDAVLSLKRKLSCGIPAVEVRAAAVILEYAFKGTEFVDMDERLTRLEAIEKEHVIYRTV